MPYHPEITVVQGLVRIVRERRLPRQAIPRTAHLLVGSKVEAVNLVLEGDVLRDYRILDVAAHFKLRHPDPEQVAEMIQVREGQRTQVGQELARRGRGRRAKGLPSPVDGLVVRVEGSRIFLQASERAVEVQAKLAGEIEAVESHKVKITGNGAVLQCAWGNGSFSYAAFKFVPEDGFASLGRLDPRISNYREMVIISPHPLTKGDLLVAQQQGAVGVVAPSMPSDLREFAMRLTFPVLLTEGFGQRRPTALIYKLLGDNMGRQAAFDAPIPDHWSWDRPEITIPLPSRGVLPPTPALDRELEVGALVRITRAPWDGLTGEVVELPAAPQVVNSGLRVPSAKVRLTGTRIGLVPLANVELLG